MDDSTARTRSPARRMATAKPASTARRGGSGKGVGKSTETEISPARWAGVALVIAALVGAIVLAVVSPSGPAATTPEQPGTVPGIPSPTPLASPAGTRVPTAMPTIIEPVGGETGEWVIAVTVDVPAEDLPKRDLRLVVLRGDEVVGEKKKPNDDGKEVVAGVRLVEGPNTLRAALRGPDGLGPRSAPVTITLDLELPVLTITSPQNKTTTFEDTIEVTGTSEPGAELRISNRGTDFDQPQTVGPAGTFSVTVPLKVGTNKITVTSTDSANLSRPKTVHVDRKDGKPVIQLTAPDELTRSTLPKKVRFVVEVTDTDGQKMEGATVAWTLGGPGGRTSQSFVDETKANGKSVWVVEINGASTKPVHVGVVVTSPYGKKRAEGREIKIVP